MHEAVKADRAEISISRMQDSCLFQLIREKIRPSLETVSTHSCPRCGGAGVVFTVESVALNALRDCRAHLPKPDVKTLELRVSPAVAAQLAHPKDAARIAEMERVYGKSVRIASVADLLPEQYEFHAFGAAGQRLEVR